MYGRPPLGRRAPWLRTTGRKHFSLWSSAAKTVATSWRHHYTGRSLEKVPDVAVTVFFAGRQQARPGPGPGHRLLCVGPDGVQVPGHSGPGKPQEAAAGHCDQKQVAQEKVGRCVFAVIAYARCVVLGGWIHRGAVCLTEEKRHWAAMMMMVVITGSEGFPGGGHQGIFPKFFRGTKSGEIWLFPLETKKTTFFVEIFKIQGVAKVPSCHPRSNAHSCVHWTEIAPNSLFEYVGGRGG